MGDVSIIARRLEGGARVQYGWSGNGGCFNWLGVRLLRWYDDPKQVEYLFGLGQMKLIGMPGSENGGAPYLYTHQPDGMPHWLGTSEREIFSKIAFVDYGYFYDLDYTWYYVIPGPFRVKIPLAYIGEHLDESDYEFDERDRIARRLAEYILRDCYASDPSLQAVVQKEYPQGIEAIREDVLSASERDDPCVRLWERYKAIYDRLDDWVVVNVSKDLSETRAFLSAEIRVNGRRKEWKPLTGNAVGKRIIKRGMLDTGKTEEARPKTMRDYSGMTEAELEEAGAELIEDTYRDSVTELLAVTLRGIAFGLALGLLFSRTPDGEHFGAVYYVAVFIFGVLHSIALAAGSAYLKAVQEDADEKLPLSTRFWLWTIGAARCIPYCIALVERVFRLGRLVRAFHKYDKANR